MILCYNNSFVMDNPICFSQFFVNKLNIRSFGNVIKSKVLKNESLFLINVLQDEKLVSKLSTDFHRILIYFKDNLRVNTREDFKKYFPHDNNLNLSSVSKEEVFANCWKGLCEIIPKNFYGNHQNSKLLRSMVQRIIYSMNKQHLFVSNDIEKWELSIYPWKTISEQIAKTILNNILLWIFKYVLSSMISLNFYVTTCKLDADENKLHFFWKNKWQSFYDKNISNMIFTKVIKKYEPYCLGKRLKRNYSLCDKLKLKAIKKDIPKLHLVLKPNNDCRPIVRYKNEQQNSTEKCRIKEKLNFLKVLTGKPPTKIESEFSNLHQQWMNLNKPKLYFIKTDLSNAFGSINKEKLLKILSERHLNYQKKEKSMYLKKKAAQQFKDIITELRTPLLVRAGSTIFEWKQGLVQGYKYSPALSELYYTHLDQIYFSEHLKPSDQMRLFVRVVDDYLYITDSLTDATLFLEALSNYRNVNKQKTVINFENANIKLSEEIIFLGYSYDTINLEVSRATNVFVGQMCYKIAFSSALSNLVKFIENRIGQSGIQINGHIFNLQYNKEELIWKHIFTTFCLSANKFCTILAITCKEKHMHNYLSLYKKRVTVKLSSSIIEKLMRNKPADVNFVYCINHFRYLSWLGLSLCAKRTSKCSNLVPLINDELAKSNCIFGKWREHASRISFNGECQMPAIKELCRRTDLRAVMKRFNDLPDGFECYNHRLK